MFVSLVHFSPMKWVLEIGLTELDEIIISNTSSKSLSYRKIANPIEVIAEYIRRTSTMGRGKCEIRLFASLAL